MSARGSEVLGALLKSRRGRLNATNVEEESVSSDGQSIRVGEIT